MFVSGYGPGSGPQLAVCPGSSFLNLIPVEECTTNPDLKDLCSHERDAGVRCQPGQCKLSYNYRQRPCFEIVVSIDHIIC